MYYTGEKEISYISVIFQILGQKQSSTLPEVIHSKNYPLSPIHKPLLFFTNDIKKCITRVDHTSELWVPLCGFILFSYCCVEIKLTD